MSDREFLYWNNLLIRKKYEPVTRDFSKVTGSTIVLPIIRFSSMRLFPGFFARYGCACHGAVIHTREAGLLQIFLLLKQTLAFH